MSLTEWLGKHGVLGFRSKKKWKMAIATPVYLLIALFLYRGVRGREYHRTCPVDELYPPFIAITIPP